MKQYILIDRGKCTKSTKYFPYDLAAFGILLNIYGDQPSVVAIYDDLDTLFNFFELASMSELAWKIWNTLLNMTLFKFPYYGFIIVVLVDSLNVQVALGSRPLNLG